MARSSRHRTVVSARLVPLLVFALAQPLGAQSVLLRLDPPEGVVSRYVMHMEMRMDSPMGQDLEVMRSDVFTTVTVVEADGEEREYKARTDSANFDFPAMPMMAQSVPDVTGQVSWMRMTTRGQFLSMEFEGADVPPGADQVAAQMAGGTFGMELPEQPVSPGESWSASQEFDMPGASGQPAAMSVEAVYTLERVAGDMVFLSMAGPVSVSDAGAQLSGTGDMTGTLQLDMANGRLVQSDMRLSIGMAAQGMEVAMRQTITMDLLDDR